MRFARADSRWPTGPDRGDRVSDAAAPVEIELKLSIDPAAVATLRTHPALRAVVRGRARTARVVSTYYDTADQRLRSEGVALRLRHDGRRWLMTVKGAPLPDAASGVVSRPEHEWPLAGPQIDTMRLATTPWRAVFAKALRKGGLAPAFSTDFRRTSLPLAFPDGTTATLAIDLGRLDSPATGLRAATWAGIAEIEIELRGGDPRRLLDLASSLAADLPLATEPRSKAERGYALAEGTADEPSRAGEIVHPDESTAAAAIARVVAECVRQIERNTLGFRAGALRDPEWIHQMRIGVRRLRSCIALAEGVLGPDAIERLRHETRWVLDTLGPARDLDVFALETLPAVDADLTRSAGKGSATATALHSLARRTGTRRRAAHAAAVECVTSPRFTRFVLATYGAAQPAPVPQDGTPAGAGAEDARRYAARLIDQRARRLAKAGRHLANGGVDERHAIRIAAKKLRYATEFFATLFPARRARAYRKALAVLQDELGAFNDAAVAPRVAAALAGPTAAATVAIESWSAGRAGASGRGLAAAWSAFEAVAPFWKRD